MRNWWIERSIRAQAHRDADAGIEANPDHLIAATIGPRPREAGEVEDGLLLDAERHTHAIRALDDEVAALDQQLSHARSRPGMAAVGVLAFFVETMATSYALEALGFVIVRERVVLSLSVATATLLLAAGVTQVERATSSTALRFALRAAVAALYLLVAAAGAWLRVSIDDTEIDSATYLATFLVLGLATGTPAIAAHLAAAEYGRATVLVGARRVALRERRRLASDQGRAHAERLKSERAGAEWDARGQRLRSLYLLEHRRRTAELVAARGPSRKGS